MKIEEHVVESSSGEYSRKIWLLNAEHPAPEKLGIFLDGEYYVNQMDAPALLTHLQSSGEIPPMVCAFVSHVNAAARHHDLTCNPRYAEFIAKDLVRWLRAKSGALREHDHFIAGPSLGGLAATYIALSLPDTFSGCLGHSGSYWWNNEWLLKNLDQMVSGRSKFWLSVGDQETESGITYPPTGLRRDVTQIAACERLVQALNKQGHAVHYNLYKGGHEIQPWKDELTGAFTWLLAKTGGK